MDNLLFYGWTIFGAALFVGLCIGSFLNVVIYRLPIMLERLWRHELSEMFAAEQVVAKIDAQVGEQITNGPEQEKEEEAEPFNLMVPRSCCPHCKHLIHAWQNIPVISWLLLRGKCSNCKEKISIRYPIVELLTGICTLVIVATFGYTWLGLACLFFTWALIALTMIDLDTQLLPDQITLPLVWLGLLTNLSGGIVQIEDAIIGAVAGYLSLWSVYWAFKLITGKEGMGYGDFKLLAAIGAWLGWQVLPGAILVASIVGLLGALIGIALKKNSRQEPIAFGPYLAISGWVCLLARDTVLSFYLL